MAEKLEITFRVDPTVTRHKAAVVLLDEIGKLESAHNELDAEVADLRARLAAVEAECDAVMLSPDTTVEKIARVLAVARGEGDR